MSADKTLIDCHLHVLDPARFPYPETAGGYRPTEAETAPFEMLEETLAEHGVTGGLLVQPSGYGFDNAALRNALEWGSGRYRGIAVVDPGRTRAADARSMIEDGVIGCRLNLLHGDRAAADRDNIRRLMGLAVESGWFLEILGPPAAFEVFRDSARSMRPRLVVDHFGIADPAASDPDFGLAPLFRLADVADDLFVKLSAPYRVSKAEPPWEYLLPVVARLLSVLGSDRFFWGSDWPHINLEGRPRPDYPALISAVRDWLGSEDLARRVLAETPARLFGFRVAA